MCYAYKSRVVGAKKALEHLYAEICDAADADEFNDMFYFYTVSIL